VATLLAVQPAVAEPVATAPVPSNTEAELLTRIAAADPRLARIRARTALAEADVVAASVRPNPSLSGEREEVFPDDGLATNYLRLSLPMQISGRRGRQVDAARAAARAVQSEGDADRIALEIEALRVFRTAAFAQAYVDLLNAERAALVHAVDVVRKRTSAGSASGYDLQRIELELAAYDDLLAAGQIAQMTARIEVGALAGVSGELAATGPLDLPPDPPALEALLGRGFAERPDMRAARFRVESADALASAGRRANVPELTLTGGLMTQEFDAGQSGRGYVAGLALTIPLFDHGQAERARAAAQRRTAEAERAVLYRMVPAAIRARHEALVRTLARARAVQRDQIARLDQLLRSAETGYREGGGNVIELLDAYKTARDTRLRELELRRDARLAELDLWLALGRRP